MKTGVKREQPIFKPVTAGPAGALAEQPVSMTQKTGEPSSDGFESEEKSADTEIVQIDVKKEQPMSKPVTAGPAGALAEQATGMVQERGEAASVELESEDKSASTEIAKTNVKKEPPVFKPVTAGTAHELELELMQSHMTQKPILRGEVGAFRFKQPTSTAKR